VVEPDHLPPSAAASVVPAKEEPGIEEAVASLVRRWAEARLADSDSASYLYERLLRLVEPPLLQAAIEKHHGQCAAAARRLGMHRTTLRKKLDQYGIEDV
jgi:two-component system nitrogen regulation response regulator GlnG